MSSIKAIFVAVILVFGLSVVSANQASDIKKLQCLIADIADDIEDYPVKAVDAEVVYDKYVTPLMEDRDFVDKLYRYRKDGAKYLGQAFANFAEIDYLVAIREYFINNKPKYDNENIDKGLYEIEEIILTKTTDAKFPNKASSNYEELYTKIVNFLKNNGVDYYEEYAEILIVYFSDLDNVKVDVEDYFKSKNVKEVLNYVSSHIIENGTAKDLIYTTGQVNVYNLLRDVSIKSALIQSV